MARQLQGRRSKGLILGVNIGKNKLTPLEQAGQDYLALLRAFAPLGDYLAINVSSPNTEGLRRLQARQALEALLSELSDERSILATRLGRSVPLLVKLAPDLADAELDAALDALIQAGIDGVILSNTTLRREGLRSVRASEAGGLSGAPLRALNTALIRRAARLTAGRLPIIASGGVMTADDCREKLAAGATLVQLYTGLIYAGPGLVRRSCAAAAAAF